MTVQLTEHFTLEEFIASDTADAMGISNSPDADALDGLADLALRMEDVRIILGGYPITITSGYRCPQLNDAVGGASDSAHLYGRACDFLCPDAGTPLDICRKLEGFMDALDIDQLIHECGSDNPGDEWVHLGLAPDGEEARVQALTISSDGTQTGFA